MITYDDLDWMASDNRAVRFNDDPHWYRVITAGTCDGRSCSLPAGEPCAGVVDLYACAGLGERPSVHIGACGTFTRAEVRS